MTTLSFILAATPDPDTVSPGVVGFFAIFFVAVAVVLLGLDMVRRIRRTTYRAEIKQRLDEELAAQQNGQQKGQQDGQRDGQRDAVKRDNGEDPRPEQL
jgi:hypothetical protein